MHASKLYIAVVGAGIGGLALAHALGRCGFRVTVLEQADTLSEIGSGISIWENGLQALESIGLRQDVEALGATWPEYEVRRIGKPVVTRNNKTLSLGGNVSPLIIKRLALFGVLKDNLSPDIDVVTSFRLVSITDRILKAEDGREVTADVIIGADGAHSRVREELTADMLEFCQQICFRGIASLPDGESPIPAEVFDTSRHRFGYFPLPGNDVYWFDIVDSAAASAPFSEVEAELTEMSPIIAKLISATPQNSILCHPIEQIKPVIKAHPYIALMGDAAHAMQPSLGQGACLALEDAAVLADCLRAYADTPEAGLKAYISKRKRRWRQYYKMCQQMGTGALYKGQWKRLLAILSMVHTPDWAMSILARRVFCFEDRNISF